jgi:hypothetical protein
MINPTDKHQPWSACFKLSLPSSPWPSPPRPAVVGGNARTPTARTAAYVFHPPTSLPSSSLLKPESTPVIITQSLIRLLLCRFILETKRLVSVPRPAPEGPRGRRSALATWLATTATNAAYRERMALGGGREGETVSVAMRSRLQLRTGSDCCFVLLQCSSAIHKQMLRSNCTRERQRSR